MRTHARRRDSKYLNNQGLQFYVEFFPILIWLLHFFRFDPLSRAFQIDAFVMKTLSLLVWTEGLNASRLMRFQRKTLWSRSGLNLIQFCKIIKEY